MTAEWHAATDERHAIYRLSQNCEKNYRVVDKIS